MKSRNEKRLIKHLKIRNKLSAGTSKVPRVCVFKSLHHFYAQAVNDEKHVTLSAASTQELAKTAKGNNIEAVKKVINKYQEEVIDELTDNNNLRLKEFKQFGGPLKIVELFGGKEQYIQTVKEIQKALYI